MKAAIQEDGQWDMFAELPSPKPAITIPDPEPEAEITPPEPPPAPSTPPEEAKPSPAAEKTPVKAAGAQGGRSMNLFQEIMPEDDEVAPVRNIFDEIANRKNVPTRLMSFILKTTEFIRAEAAMSALRKRYNIDNNSEAFLMFVEREYYDKLANPS